MKEQKPALLLRRFSVLYVGFGLLPFLMLFYLYNLSNGNMIEIEQDRFAGLLILIGVTAFLGFMSMRTYLRRIVDFSRSIRTSVFEKVDEVVMMKLANEEGEVGELAKSFAQILKRLDDNLQELEETKKTIHGLLGKISNVLSTVENLDNLIRLVLETAIDALSVQRGALFSSEQEQHLLRASVGMGDATADQVTASARPYLELVSSQNRVFLLPVIGQDAPADTFFPSPLVGSPLAYRGKNWGTLLLSGKKQGGNFSGDDLVIVANLSQQIAVAFENAKLNADAEQTYFETMAALAMAVEAKDSYSRGHSDRVGVYARKIGQSMGLSDADLDVLRDASRLHDIGKIGIMDSVLVKHGSLNMQERDVMNRHPVIGESIVLPLKTFRSLLDPIRHHHEYLDGSGYPDGLRGDEVSLITRILTVADIYDALAIDRPYRKAMDLPSLKAEFDRLVSLGKIDENIVPHLYSLTENGMISTPTHGLVK
jgi:HD-GYP domain-containing protein (c-di-GMP phosphodiesterase class II)